MTGRSVSSEFDPGLGREAELGRENTALLRRRVALRELHATAVAAAGSVQALAAEVGAFGDIEENDVAAAWRAARAPTSRRGSVVREHRSDLEAPFARGRWDVAVLDGTRTDPVEVAEVKWDRRSDNLAEVLWDVVKIATAIAGDRPQHAGLERGLIVVGAPTFDTAGEDVVPVLDTGTWTGGALVNDRPAAWRAACGSTSSPHTAPAGIALERVASVPIQNGRADEAAWELRVLEVTVVDRAPAPVVAATTARRAGL